jgi:tRNA-binding protein
MKTEARFESFENLDIRVGRVVAVEEAATRKPTYRLRVDFGGEIGEKVSCGAFTRYSREEILGRLVVAVVNFGAKRMGPEISEVLILGVPDGVGGTVCLTPEEEVKIGVAVF